MFKQNMNRISKILKRSIEKGETREFVKKMKNDPNSTYNRVKRAVDTTLQEAQNNNDLRQALRQSLSMDIAPTTKRTREERIKQTTDKKTFFVRYKFEVRERFLKQNMNWSKWYFVSHINVKTFNSAKTDLSKIDEKIIRLCKLESDINNVYYQCQFLKLVNYTIIDRSKINRRVDITKLRMTEARPLKYDWLPEVDQISLTCTNNRCVEVAFEERYLHARRPKSAKDLYKWCNEYYRDEYEMYGVQSGYKPGNLDSENGYDCKMLAYACFKMDITFMCFDTNHKLLIKQLSKNQNLPPWVFYCAGEHMYMITDKATLESIVKKNADKVVSSIFHGDDEEKEKKELPVYDFTNIYDLETIDAPSIVIVQKSELSDIFKDIVQKTHCVPMVRNKGERTIKEIIYKRKDKQKVFIQCDSNNGTILNYKDIQALCKKLNVPFVNQGMGTLIRDYYNRFTNKKRKDIDRDAFFAKNCKCVACGATKNLQIDHIIALANGGLDEESNYQALCKTCHFVKSKDEKEDGYIKIPVIESSFNSKVREIFDSDLMKKWAFVEKLGEYKSLYGYDINKCRKNILYYSKYKWPVFSVMDDVAKFDGVVKCGMYYIESDNLFPLHGNGWYTEPMVNYCLEQGIIKTNNIKYQIVSALEQINCDYFKPFIDLVYNNFDDLSKIAINAFIGCFYRQETKKTFSKYTRSLDEACYLFTENKAKFTTYDKQLKLYQVLNEETIKFEETEAPIYLQVLDIEAIEAHKLSKIVGKASFVKTDCIYSENFVDISKYEWAPGVPKYKYENVKETNYEVLPQNCRSETFTFVDEQFKVVVNEDDYTGLTQEQKDELLKKLATQVLELGCVNIDGRAGTGKSYLIDAMKKELEVRENKYICLAPTNKAARNIKGLTIHKYIGGGKCTNIKNVNCRALKDVNYIFIDEISMVHEIFYKVFLTIKSIKPDIKFIIAGDFAQLKPVKDRANFNYKNSRALYELCMGNRLVLTKCRRSDDILFKLCQDVNNVDISKFGKTQCSRSICFTNYKRLAVNKMWMDKMSIGKKYIMVPKLAYDSNSQDMKICVGTPVIARVNNGELWANNDTFNVVSIKKGIELDSGDVIAKEEFARLFNVAYCLTCHKSQGETIKEDYTIYEWSKMDEELRYVALSRGICKEKINIIA